MVDGQTLEPQLSQKFAKCGSIVRLSVVVTIVYWCQAPLRFELDEINCVQMFRKRAALGLNGTSAIAYDITGGWLVAGRPRLRCVQNQLISIYF